MTSAHSRRTAGWIPVRGPGRTRSPSAAGAQLRPLARRVHFLAGILVAPFLLILCLTGLAYVFSPQIHDDLYSGQLFVSQVGAARQPLSRPGGGRADGPTRRHACSRSCRRPRRSAPRG